MLLLVLGGLAALPLLFLPAWWLPSIALCLLVAVPRQLFANSDILNSFSLALLVVVIWRLRDIGARPGDSNPAGGDRKRFIYTLLIVYVLWMTLVTLVAGLAPFRVTYIAAFVLSVFLPLTSRSPRAARALLSTWQVLAVVVAAYCAVEFLLRENPIYDPLIAAAGGDAIQHWSVYRASASLGHPLYAGLFLCIAFAIGVGRKLEGGTQRHIWAAAAALIGVLLTVSRNSLGAAGMAAAVLVLASILSSKSRVSGGARFLFAIVLGLGLFAAAQSTVFQERASSAEADSSTAARSALFDLTVTTANAYKWLGAGAASAADAAAPFNANGIYIEGAYFQLVISLGIPGLAMFLLIVIASILRALRHGRYAAAGVMIAYAISIGFTPVLESLRSYLLVFGFALWLCWSKTALSDGPTDEADLEPATDQHAAKSNPAFATR
ncbi:O-antigen ligase family protein [Microbacterium arborescens]|nr:O-antigen ligase family protein [Microbacterium arborescens]